MNIDIKANQEYFKEIITNCVGFEPAYFVMDSFAESKYSILSYNVRASNTYIYATTSFHYVCSYKDVLEETIDVFELAVRSAGKNFASYMVHVHHEEGEPYEFWLYKKLNS